jgi:predicted GNAT family acetyltransferase
MSASSRYLVRVARVDDLAGVLAVHAEHAGEVLGSATERQLSTWQRMMVTSDLTVYVAELGERLVATATTLVMPNLTYGCAPTVFVEAVVVSPRHRRQGVATAMLERILTEARSAGCHKVQLLSHKRHATDGAHRLYASIGFVAEAEGFRLYLSEAPNSRAL